MGKYNLLLIIDTKHLTHKNIPQLGAYPSIELQLRRTAWSLLGVSLTQMARYETKGIQPPANVLMKLATIFGTTVDFLVNGATEDKAKAHSRMLNYSNNLKKSNFLMIKIKVW